ncbi:kinase-like domain-containing protein [Apiospora aurea]|uniref:Kinase-like domain-containing protein n=1 Tax=Apiospora aurea TaxID=335848 RepID=A0ABR1QSX8_9PEZI
MPPRPFATATSSAQQLSDLVKDSRLETQTLQTCTQHVFYETGRTAHERHVRRTEQWVRQRFLGQGAYGIVHLEKSMAGDGEKERLRAVKEIKKHIGSGEELDYARELEAIAKFSNYKYAHCFVTSHGWFETNESVFIAMEYLAHGDLQQHLTRPLSEIEAKQITAQVLEGLQYMHENGFVHRDLKPGNIMVVNKGPPWFVKIADFGISKRRQQDVTTLHTLQRGTLGFAAPEVFGFGSDKKYTFSVDMWSLGAVAYRILTQSTPFPTIADLSAYVFKQKGFPTALFEAHKVSETAQNLIAALMMPDPQDRLTATTAAQHEWLSGTPSSFIGQQPASECVPCSVKTMYTLDITDSKDRTSFPPSTMVHTDEVAFTAASNAWSTDTITVALANTTLRDTTIETPNYQPPTVSGHLEEETIQGPKLPVDSVVLLEEVRPTTPAPVDGSTEEPRSREEVDHRHTSSMSDLTQPVSSEAPASTTQLPAVASAQDPSSMRMELQDDARFNEVAHIVDEHASDREQGERGYAGRDDEQSDYEDTEYTTSDTESVEETRMLAFQCHWCSELTKGSRSGPTEQLACQHVVCHACLLEAFALSLISPVYMAPRCCGEVIPLWHFRNIVVRPEVNEAWRFMYGFTEKMRAGPWLCPKGPCRQA